MKYIRKFNTVAEYNAAKTLGLDKPNVSYVVENDTVYYLGDNIIEIADANAKAILVDNYDLDGDGEISKQEALAVTDASNFKALFGYNSSNKTTFTDLTFFKYFKNASWPSDSSSTFRDCSNVTAIDVSDNDFSHVTTLYGFLRGDTKLSTVNMRDLDLSNVTDFGGFLNHSNLNQRLTIDFSNTLFPESATFTNFVYAIKYITFIMNGCTSAAVELIKSFIHNSNYVADMKIIVDGKQWTCSSKGGTWVESDVAG